MTLQDLALDAMFEDEYGNPVSCEAFIDWYEGFLEHSEETCLLYKSLYIKAKVYVIARDQGLNAAMLYKLTYG